MKFTCTKRGVAVFFDLAGRLTINDRMDRVHAAVRDISDPRVHGVFVDLGNVTRLDCAGIGKLIQLRSQVVGSGRVFGLVNLERRQRELLELLRVSAVCRIFGSREEALRSFAPVGSSTAPATNERGLMTSPVSARLGPLPSLQPRWAASCCLAPRRDVFG